MILLEEDLPGPFPIGYVFLTQWENLQYLSLITGQDFFQALLREM